MNNSFFSIDVAPPEPIETPGTDPKVKPEIEPDTLPDEEPGIQPGRHPGRKDDDDDENDNPFAEPAIGDDPDTIEKKTPMMQEDLVSSINPHCSLSPLIY